MPLEKRPFRGRYPSVIEMLYDNKIIKSYPVQVVREDLEYDEGIDIYLSLNKMTPQKFQEWHEQLLLAAYTLADRYADITYKFAKITVELNRTKEAERTEAVKKRRDYIASRHRDHEVMVYGEEALPMKLPEDYTKRPFLINRMKEILDIPDTTSPGDHVQKQNPYVVKSLMIGIRAGLRSKGVPE